MFDTLNFLAITFSTYFVLSFTSILLGVTFLIGTAFIDRFYIGLLLRIFQYASSRVKNQQNVNTEPDNENEIDDDIENSKPSNGFYDYTILKREITLSDQGIHFHDSVKPQGTKFDIWDCSYFIKSGIEAIVEDDVTKRFTAEQLEAWNLLSRTHSYQHINFQLSLLWIVGFCVRYFILLPTRLLIAVTAVISVFVLTLLISLIPNQRLRRFSNRLATIYCFRLFIRAFSGVLNFHHKENRPKSDGICVANHTTPIDVIILGCDNAYAMVGQKHSGFMGFMQDVFSRATPQVWFERSEVRDRLEVARRMRAHVEDTNKLPLLVFPEGTCINNTSVMMFKKGSFEVGATIYPVAIKYDARFSDCFWNSSKYSLLRYLFMMMTSWAIKADIWYLPPEHQRHGESAIDFANRVKKLIATKGGLVDLQWDGALKREKPKASLKLAQQESYSRFIKTGLASK